MSSKSKASEAKPSIRAFTTKELIPDVPEKYRSLLDTRLIPQQCSFEINNVNLGVANGVRRILHSELLTKVLKFAREDFISTDEFQIVEMIEKRMSSIPISQSISNAAKFSLHAVNNSKETLDVKTSSISIVSGVKSLPFNSNITICTLQPGKSLTIKNIKIDESYGYLNSLYTMCFNTSCVPLDQKPKTIFYNHVSDSDEVPASLSNPRKHKIQFTTNGVLDPKMILQNCCASIVSRLEKTREIINELNLTTSGEFIYTIPNESDTIGNMVVRQYFDAFPDANITYSVNTNKRELYIRVKEITKTQIIKIVDELIQIFEKLDQF